jgi:hypothetical protein
MQFSRLFSTAIMAIMLSLFTIEDVSAGGLFVDCRVRDKPRSEITMRGNGFRPWKKIGRRKIKIKYFAVAYSGNNIAQASSKPPTSSRNLEFYFDSNVSDLTPGDTQISPTFINGGAVTGEIRLKGKNTRLAVFNATCRSD